MNIRAIGSILLFVIVTFPMMIVVTRILATIFGAGPEQTIGSAIAWITLVVGWIKRVWDSSDTDQQPDTEIQSESASEDSHTDTDEDGDTGDATPGPAVEPQSQAYTFRDSDASTPSDDTGTEDGDATADTGRQSSLRRSNDTIISDAERQLDGRITFYDDGTIDLDADDLDLYSQMMLYVVAKRLVYEDGLADRPAVTIEEIQNQFDYNKIEIMLFLRKARNWLVPATEQSPGVGTIDYQELPAVAVTVITRSLSEIADWILEDEQPYPDDVAYGVGNAGTALSVAENQYKKAKEEAADEYSTNADIHYGQVRQKVQRACIDVTEYPILFERDFAWTEFTKYAEALLDYMDEGHPEKISHCLPRMQRYRNQMKETADDASYI